MSFPGSDNLGNNSLCILNKFGTMVYKFLKFKFSWTCLMLTLVLIGGAIIIQNFYLTSFISKTPLAHHISGRKEAAVSFLTYEPVVWLYAEGMETGYLDHVMAVFRRLGYTIATDRPSKWDILWSHTYPFTDELSESISHLKPWQRVNHIVGSGYITNKASLMGAKLSCVPAAFLLPEEAAKLRQFAEAHPEALWVQKSNEHRGVRVTSVADVNMSAGDTFVQRFVDRPLLVDGRKFDIGVYVLLAGVNPLRVYALDDWLLRFCPQPYEPFDPALVDKYVVADNYTPLWLMPSLKHFYQHLKFNFKQSLFAYLRSRQLNHTQLQMDIFDAIRDVYLTQEVNLISAAASFASQNEYFELVRFDFVVDSQLKAYLMEVNMSPNLSSAHFHENKLLYEQVLFNVFSLLGFASRAGLHWSVAPSDAADMMVSERDLAVEAELCGGECWPAQCSARFECQLCAHCSTRQTTAFLKDAFLEHQRRYNCRRVLPEPVGSLSHPPRNFSARTLNDKLLYSWFVAKCAQDASWCN